MNYQVAHEWHRDGGSKPPRGHQDAHSPSQKIDLSAVFHPRSGPLSEHNDSTGPLEKGYKDTNTKFDETDPYEVLIPQCPDKKRREPGNPLSHHEDSYKTGDEEADNSIAGDKSEAYRQKGRDNGGPVGIRRYHA